MISEKVNAMYVCQIFSQLSLNFVKLPEELTDTSPIIKTNFNLYKPSVLMTYNKQSNSKQFVSILKQYEMPSKKEKQSQDHYNNSKSSSFFLQIWY